MSEKSTSVLLDFPDGIKTFIATISAAHLATKDDSRGGLVEPHFLHSAERLLSEQSVRLLGEANGQQLKENYV